MKNALFKRFVLFCITMVVVRFLRTGEYSYFFLIWNLLLAWLPLLFIRLIKNSDPLMKKLILIALSVLFLPNAPYILTDLFHLQQNLAVPQWFDLILILSFGFSGMFYFILALDLILHYIHSSLPFLIKIAKLLLFILTSYGIYLGRYLRFNSWDIFSNPMYVAGGIYHSVFDLAQLKIAISVTVTFTVFLYLLYEIYLSFKRQNLTSD
ncbi:MAG: putative rane protein [Bacteroidetes bacterium]|nr:putative rane protein [Bacteroidota bacterium]